MDQAVFPFLSRQLPTTTIAPPPEIRHIFSKAGLELGTPGSAAWAFTKTTDGYTPNTPLELDDETGEKLAEFIEKLEDQDDVTDVFYWCRHTRKRISYASDWRRPWL
jgi:hypothetical protein